MVFWKIRQTFHKREKKNNEKNCRSQLLRDISICKTFIPFPIAGTHSLFSSSNFFIIHWKHHQTEEVIRKGKPQVRIHWASQDLFISLLCVLVFFWCYPLNPEIDDSFVVRSFPGESSSSAVLISSLFLSFCLFSEIILKS